MSPRYLIGVPAAIAALAAAVVFTGESSRLANTIFVASGACAISLPIGSLLAGVLFRSDLPGRRLFAVFFVSLLFVPLFLQAAAWDGGFGRLGWLTFSRGDPSQPLLSGWLAAVWIHAVHAVPWVILIVGMALRRVEPSLEQAALLDASPRRVFWQVTMGRSLPAIVLAGLWVFLTVATDMTVTDLYAVETIPRSLYNGFALGDSVATAWLRALPLMSLFAVVLTTLLYIAVRRSPRSMAGTKQLHRFSLGPGKWWKFTAVSLVLLACVAVPMANLIFKAGQTVLPTDGQPLRVWSLEALATRFLRTQAKFGREHFWTFVIAGVSSCVTLLAAFPLAWWMRAAKKSALVPIALTGFLLALPAPLLGLSLVALFNSVTADWFYELVNRTIFAPVVAMTLRTLPLTTLAIWYALRTIPQQSLESAAVEGAGPRNQWTKVALPQLMRPLLVVWLMSYLISAGDLAASVLVVPPGISTFSIRIFGMLHAGVTDEVACVCIAQFSGFVVLGTLVALLTRNRPD